MNIALTKVRDYLAKKYPKRSFCISEQQWFYGRLGQDSRSTDFQISVMPAFDERHDSQTFGGNSIDECLQKLTMTAKLKGH